MDERETVRLQREAFINGACVFGSAGLTSAMVVDHARARYPMPPVERPRVVTWHEYEYRVVDGTLQLRTGYDKEWVHLDRDMSEKYRAIADLFSRPTEVVTEEEEN